MPVKKLYRLPEKGMLKGVCAGLAEYWGIPVKLLRIIAVLSLFFGLFMFTLLLYIVLSFYLEPPPEQDTEAATGSTCQQLFSQSVELLQDNEQRLRQIERYVTSETFSVRSRFRQL